MISHVQPLRHVAILRVKLQRIAVPKETTIAIENGLIHVVIYDTLVESHRPG